MCSGERSTTEVVSARSICTDWHVRCRAHLVIQGNSKMRIKTNLPSFVEQELRTRSDNCSVVFLPDWELFSERKRACPLGMTSGPVYTSMRQKEKWEKLPALQHTATKTKHSFGTISYVAPKYFFPFCLIWNKEEQIKQEWTGNIESCKKVIKIKGVFYPY